MGRFNKFAGVAVAGALLLATPYTASAQLVISKTAAKCAATLGKSSAKVAKTYVKEVGKCLDDDISGKVLGACPNAGNETKIDKAKQKLSDSVVKKCKSTCSVSGVECVADALCPPLPSIEAFERCSGGATGDPFDYTTIGFPGALCKGVVGGILMNGEDLGTCTAEVTANVATDLVAVVYGSITGASGISPEAAKCLKSITKAAIKLSGTIHKGIVKCRNAILTNKVLGNPATCTTDDVKLADKIAKAEDKLSSIITAKCTDDQISELDLCLQGPGAVTTTGDAIDCLIPAVSEITDTPLAPIDRVYSPNTLVEAAYPPEAACGDGVVNQVANSFHLLGEECDLDDDSACPGNCLPPGDVYQCTCSTTSKRMRFQADGFTADLDNGWTGTSHNSGVTDKAGWIVDVSGCDCDAMSGMTCVGTTTDTVCNLLGRNKPTCSWEPLGSTRCEARGGDLDNVDDNDDCYICDQFSTNAGAFCDGESDCTGQCYDAAGVAQGTCANGQSDCGPGEICRGQCDRSHTCIIIPNGSPLPISSGGTAVCVLTTFRFDIAGTMNISTGEHAVNIQQYSKTHLGVSNTTPCPTCGGFCDGGTFLDGDVCEGSCSVTTSTACRFNSDCPSGETCTTVSPNCPAPGFCNLSLVCNGGSNDAQPCRIGAPTDKFGTTSNDCPPLPAQNISGTGLTINFLPQTSEVVTLPATLPCTAPGYELFDCPCPDGGGRRTQPSLCAFTCDAGAEFGIGCGNGAGGIYGFPTNCAGGVNAGRACDEDSDCPSSSCSANPKHCLGDPAFERFPCTSDAECGTGTCVDACPSGRCTQVCLPADDPLFPPGFGGRSADDPEEGLCAAGPPTYHCSGAQDDYRICDKLIAEGNCLATCSISSAPCTPLSPCGPGEGTCTGLCEVARVCEAGSDGVLGNADDFPQAGICIPDARRCSVSPITAEGGDTLNGKGDPTNVRNVATYCIPPTSNNAINSTAGLGGPGRLRQNGVNVTNGFTTLP